MAAKKNFKRSKPSDLEYEYSEDHDQEQETEPEETKTPATAGSKPLGGFSRKKIIIWILIITLVIGIFQYLTHKKETAPRVPKVEAESTQKNIRQAPATSAEKNQQNLSMPEVNVNRNLQVKYDAEIRDLQAGLQNVNRSVGELQNTLITLTSSVETLSTQVQALSKAQQAAPVNQEYVPTEPGKAPPHKHVIKTVYHLKALIQGRAWLESADGKVITVKVGDTLAGYGTIDNIDTEAGKVDTSSGSIIHYGPNDS